MDPRPIFFAITIYKQEHSCYHIGNNKHKPNKEDHMNAQNIIKTICSETTSRAKVSDLCDYIQQQLAERDLKCSIVNHKGIDLPDRKHDWFNSGTIWFRRDNANDCWIAFTVVNGENVRL